MLSAVRCGVGCKRGQCVEKLRSKIRIDGQVSKRRLPFALVHYGEWMAAAGVVGAKYDRTIGNFNSRKYCASHLPGINVAGVRDNAADGADRLLLGREIGVHIGTQNSGIRWIESSRNRW